MVSMVDSSRIAPVQSDLTLDNDPFRVLRGFENMNRVDYPLEDSTVQLSTGEWCVLGADGKVTRPGATGVRTSYPVFCGTERTDVFATGGVTVIVNSPIVFETTVFDPSVTYTPGMLLTAKDTGGGKAWLTAATAGTDAVVAVVQQVTASGYLVCEYARS